MNRRRFFSSLFAAPVAAAVALKSKTFASGGIVDAPSRPYVFGEQTTMYCFKLDEDAKKEIAKAINDGWLSHGRMIRKESAIG